MAHHALVQDLRTASTTASDGCRLDYTYRDAEKTVVSVCITDVMGRMCPATKRDREDAQWHLENCVGTRSVFARSLGV